MDDAELWRRVLPEFDSMFRLIRKRPRRRNLSGAKKSTKFRRRRRHTNDSTRFTPADEISGDFCRSRGLRRN